MLPVDMSRLVVFFLDICDANSTMYSARHGFANLRRYMGMGWPGMGVGPTSGTRMKPVPVAWVWRVFLRHYYSNHRYCTVYATNIFETIDSHQNGSSSVETRNVSCNPT